MHLYFIPRGIRHSIEIFEKFMQTQMFAWKRVNVKTKKEEITMVQGAYRDAGPVKEYIFPEECLDEVLEMLGYYDKTQTEWGISDFKNFWLRRMLGNKVRKIPKKIKVYPDIPKMSLLATREDGTQEYKPYRYIERRGVIIDFIGIKKDERQNNAWGYKQEML